MSARLIAGSPVVQSVLLHRSAATGEVSIGRSDIDLLLVVDEEQARDGERVAQLCRRVERARLFNPALSHLDVFDAAGLARQMEMDTIWASVERRAWIRLAGRPIEVMPLAISKEHAVGKLLQWAEWFFAIAVQENNRRNLWKTALECWNAYACAAGLLDEPLLTREEMEQHAGRCERGLETKRLGEAEYAARFVFELVARLHAARRPPLNRLKQPLVFASITAPLCLPRVFVVVPEADSVLPEAVHTDGAWPCTPELLDLFIHTKNPFLHWALPPELVELGIEPPAPGGFLRACRLYGHRRLLFVPCFAVRRTCRPSGRLALLRHAAEWALRGEMPPPVAAEMIRELIAGCPVSSEEYYRGAYGRLLEENRQLEELVWRNLESSAHPGPVT